jgi:NitT/TauT family transport system permease protein
MANYEKELENKVPDFKTGEDASDKTGKLDMSGALSVGKIHGWKQILGILGVAIIVLGGWELIVRLTHTPEYVLPAPTQIVVALIKNMPVLYNHFFYTLGSLAAGYIIGSLIGLVMAAVLIQIPFLEKIITPYIILLITTPAIALVPLLMLKLGFGVTPRLIVIALAAGPMVMINAVTGFRRTDLAKIALAKSYGASNFQIFTKIRFPLALPMINVGLLVGGIFGLITAVGADMVGGKIGLGNRIAYYSSLGRMSTFFAVVLMVSVIGISLWLAIAKIGSKWASWQE